MASGEAEKEKPRRAPSLDEFLGEPTRRLDDWQWLWKGDREFPIRSHRAFWGSLLVLWKKLLRPFVKPPQNDLWERQRIFNLILLEHLIELRKKCYEPLKRQLEASVPQDYEIEPTRMEDSLGSLRLTSDPPGARIYINGDAKGVTPTELEAVCSGKIRLEVKHQAGKFTAERLAA